MSFNPKSSMRANVGGSKMSASWGTHGMKLKSSHKMSISGAYSSVSSAMGKRAMAQVITSASGLEKERAGFSGAFIVELSIGDYFKKFKMADLRKAIKLVLKRIPEVANKTAELAYNEEFVKKLRQQAVDIILATGRMAGITKMTEEIRARAQQVYGLSSRYGNTPMRHTGGLIDRGLVVGINGRGKDTVLYVGFSDRELSKDNNPRMRGQSYAQVAYDFQRERHFLLADNIGMQQFLGGLGFKLKKSTVIRIAARPFMVPIMEASQKLTEEYLKNFIPKNLSVAARIVIGASL